MTTLLQNLQFSIRGEQEMMAAILDRHETPEVAASEWLKANPTAVKAWLAGVLTFDGRPALGALANAAPPPHPGGFEQWIVGHKLPVGAAMASAIDTVKHHGTFVFEGISTLIRATVELRIGERGVLELDGDTSGRSPRLLADQLLQATTGNLGLGPIPFVEQA